MIDCDRSMSKQTTTKLSESPKNNTFQANDEDLEIKNRDMNEPRRKIAERKPRKREERKFCNICIALTVLYLSVGVMPKHQTRGFETSFSDEPSLLVHS